MKKILWICLIIILVYATIITILYFNVNNNYKELNKKYDLLVHTEAPLITYTFYAKIESVDKVNNTILIKGLDFDTVYKKEYLLKITDETQLIGNGNTQGSNILKISDFNSNQYISVTYGGAIKNEKDYDGIDLVTRIQLLEDLNNN